MNEKLPCGASLARCFCTKPAGHEPEDKVHQCDPEKCGGEWERDENGEVRIIGLPVLGRIPGLAEPS